MRTSTAILLSSINPLSSSPASSSVVVSSNSHLVVASSSLFFFLFHLTMLLLTKLLPLLVALTASAQSTAPPSTQHAFSFASLPPSAYSPTHISSNIELGGSLTRSSATYALEKDAGAVTTGDKFVVGIKGGGKSGGWIEATEGKGGNRKKLDLVAVGGNEYAPFLSSLQLIPSRNHRVADVEVEGTCSTAKVEGGEEASKKRLEKLAKL